MYDASGSLQKTQNYIYDNGHRLLNDGIYSYTYGAPSCSCANRIETVTDVRGVTRYEYDYKGRVKKTIYPDGTTVESIYNDSAKTKTVKLDGNVIFILNLDGEGRASGTNAIIEQVGGGNNVFSITRDNAGRIKEVKYPNEDRSVTEYDVEGRIVKHKNYTAPY